MKSLKHKHHTSDTKTDSHNIPMMYLQYYGQFKVPVLRLHSLECYAAVFNYDGKPMKTYAQSHTHLHTATQTHIKDTALASVVNNIIACLTSHTITGFCTHQGIKGRSTKTACHAMQ